MDDLFNRCFEKILNRKNLGYERDYYYRNYWLQMDLYKLSCLNIIIEIFDYALEVGCTEAVKTAQKITFIEEIGIMNRFTAYTINNFQKSFLYHYQHARKVHDEFINDNQLIKT